MKNADCVTGGGIRSPGTLKHPASRKARKKSGPGCRETEKSGDERRSPWKFPAVDIPPVKDKDLTPLSFHARGKDYLLPMPVIAGTNMVQGKAPTWQAHNSLSYTESTAVK